MEIMEVLIIDAIGKLYEALSIDWEKYFIYCHKTDSIQKAFDILKSKSLDVIILAENDLMQTDIWDKLHTLRYLSHAILILASYSAISHEYKVKALDYGFLDVWEISDDDSLTETSAKGRAIIRECYYAHKNTKTPLNMYIYYPITLVIENRLVFVKDKQIDLSRKEFEILKILMSSPDRVFTHDQIVRDIWGEDYSDEPEKLLRPHIARIKRKLQADSDLPTFIKTIHGVGYSFGTKK